VDETDSVAARALLDQPGFEDESHLDRPEGDSIAEPGLSALGLALGVIVLNIAVQALAFGLERSAQVQPDTAISIGLWVGLAFYGVVAYVALRNRAAGQVHTRWTIGDPRLGWLGLLIGGAAAAAVLGLQELTTHQAMGDVTARVVVSDGSVARIAAALVLFVVVGPVIEEFVFRGVLAEALRPRGIRVSLLVSSLLFAVAHLHLQPANLIYYSLCGWLLGTIYFRLGLKGSILGHAAFNGVLLAAAILSVVGPARTYTIDGATIHLPASWKTVASPELTSSQRAFEGPSASAILIMDRPLAPGQAFNPVAVEAAAAANRIPMPSGSRISSVHTETLPAGEAVIVNLVSRGQPGEVALFGQNNHEWVLVLSTAGSSQAKTDFEGMLQRLSLP
jgi:membrane protease YdiL (CAAX protease family)